MVNTMILDVARFIAVCVLLASAVSAQGLMDAAQLSFWKPPVTSRYLRSNIILDNVLKHARELESFAYRTPLRNRLIGTQGHNDTVTYIYNQLTSPALGGFYNVTLQPWLGSVQVSGRGSLSVNGGRRNVSIADFSPSGDATAPIAVVNDLGCSTLDYPVLTGRIALISRGNCTFNEKSARSGRAGAVGAIIYDNVPGGIPGMTLGTENPNGPTVPTVGLSQADGQSLVALIKAGTAISGTLNVKTVIVNATTYNVVATTKEGDQNSVLVLGAHSDSVAAGPGINDDGSGTIGILEVAKQLARYRVRNAVRFGFWSGEEEGLLGSQYYVSHLSPTEKKKIKLYLNFDMIASPNYIYGIFDGDGGDFNLTGPQGSGDIERLYEDYFESQDLNYTSISFTGRSDYDPFTRAGIPAGGVETGAEGIKTKAEQEEFGGQAGIAYDINYHGPGDNVTNLNREALYNNTKAIAHGVATYARSFSSVTFNDTMVDEDEDELKRRRSVVRRANDQRKGKSLARRLRTLNGMRSHKVFEERVNIRSKRFRKEWF